MLRFPPNYALLLCGILLMSLFLNLWEVTWLFEMYYIWSSYVLKLEYNASEKKGQNDFSTILSSHRHHGGNVMYGPQAGWDNFPRKRGPNIHLFVLFEDL